MSRLSQLQAELQRRLLAGGANGCEFIASDGVATADVRLRVYEQAYRLRLIEALGKDYPGLRGLIGAEHFADIANAYIDACPSHHPSLRWFGRQLAEHLRRTANDVRRQLWAEVAAFEWMTGECFDAVDAPVAGVGSVAGIPADRWAALRLRFQPGIRRLRLRWNAPAIWQAARDGQPLDGTEPAAVGVPWLLWRRDMKIYWRSLADDEDDALASAMAGATFGELCERLAATCGADAAPMRAASLLRQWLTDAMIAGVDLDDRNIR